MRAIMDQNPSQIKPNPTKIKPNPSQIKPNPVKIKSNPDQIKSKSKSSQIQKQIQIKIQAKILNRKILGNHRKSQEILGPINLYPRSAPLRLGRCGRGPVALQGCSGASPPPLGTTKEVLGQDFLGQDFHRISQDFLGFHINSLGFPRIVIRISTRISQDLILI